MRDDPMDVGVRAHFALSAAWRVSGVQQMWCAVGSRESLQASLTATSAPLGVFVGPGERA